MKFKKFKFKKVKSTNNTAIRIIKETKHNLGMIIAETQVNGRGQYGKKWISLKGNLFMSVFFEIKKKINLKKITKTNCYIVRDCLQKLTDFKILIKNPNDLLIKKQKICGILQETIFKNEKKFLVVGIGLNLNKSPKIKNYQTNFINYFTKKNVTRFQIFKLLCNSYEKKITIFK